jgi:5-methylcytosine-specific restriction endonuclease McrA
MSATIDHIIPVNGPGGLKGHPSSIDNLQLAHFSCNRQKSDKIFKEKQVFKPIVLGNRNLPQSIDWRSYRGD